ncbi:putative RNA-directed DNA polymerase from transposon X-element [Trichonephila clavipes]|nr:putative RNA-directed DNA polymerase from transposon X-element [Trichonephila clavipes]
MISWKTLITTSTNSIRSSGGKENPKLHISLPTHILLGYRGLIYDTLDKENLFADTLEDSFKENKNPYDDEHIEEVERQVHRYLRNNFQVPPLTSAGEVCEVILNLENRKAPGADQIKNGVLKSMPINAITLLKNIFNRCLMDDYFPKA